MTDPHIISTLRASRMEIERHIIACEQRLDQARRDLVHVSMTLAMFEASGDDRQVAAYVDTHRLLKRGEMVALVRQELAKGEPLDTRELSRRIAIAKGLDVGDKNPVPGDQLPADTGAAAAGAAPDDCDAGEGQGVRMWMLI